MCSLQASLLCCVAVVCLLVPAGALEQLVAGSTVVHVRVYTPPGFLRDKPEVFVRSGSHVQVTSNLHSHGLQVDRYGNSHRSAVTAINETAILTTRLLINRNKICFTFPCLSPSLLLKIEGQIQRDTLCPPRLCSSLPHSAIRSPDISDGAN